MLIWGCYRQPPYLLSELPSPMIIQWHNTWWQTGLGKIIRGIYTEAWRSESLHMQTIRLWVEFVINRNTVITSISQLTRILKCRQKTAYQQKAPSQYTSQYTSPSSLPHQIIWDYRKTYNDGKSPSKAFTLFTLMKFLLKGIPWLLKYLILVQLTLRTQTRCKKKLILSTYSIIFSRIFFFFFDKSNKWHI